jgi:hypothetical protein
LATTSHAYGRWIGVPTLSCAVVQLPDQCTHDADKALGYNGSIRQWRGTRRPNRWTHGFVGLVGPALIGPLRQSVLRECEHRRSIPRLTGQSRRAKGRSSSIAEFAHSSSGQLGGKVPGLPEGHDGLGRLDRPCEQHRQGQVEHGQTRWPGVRGRRSRRPTSAKPPRRRDRGPRMSVSA